jgi:hypothetical protein
MRCAAGVLSVRLRATNLSASPFSTSVSPVATMALTSFAFASCTTATARLSLSGVSAKSLSSAWSCSAASAGRFTYASGPR